MTSLSLASAVLAQGITNPVISELGSGEGGEIVSGILSTVVTLLLVFGVFFCIIYMMVGAYGWITGGHDKARLQMARDQIFHALIGLIILFSVFALIKFLGVVFDIDLLNLQVPGVGTYGTS